MKEAHANTLGDGRAFANELIGLTLSNAFRLDFYRQHWSGVAIDEITSVDDLERLPVLSKTLAGEMLATFQYTDRPAIVSHSSGTSTGKITVRCRSLSELQALWNVRSVPAPCEADGVIPLVMSVDGANHGQTIPTPGAAFGLKAVGFDHAVVEHVLQQITKTYAFPGVSNRVRAIDAPLGFIKLLTLELITRGINPASLGIELLSTFGEYVTTRWSTRLEALWHAAHIDRYATSEAVGGARRCRKCGWLSFFPESWPEVVDMSSGATLPQGIGLLSLTELFPFSQLQPMIRFLPGDLVELRNVDCSGRLGRTFRFLGRVDRALIDNDGPVVLLYPAEVGSCLDGLPSLQREPTFHTLPLAEYARDLGAPYCELRLDRNSTGKTIIVSVVPKFSADIFPNAAANLQQEIYNLLVASCSGLAEMLTSRAYQLQIELRKDAFNIRGFLVS